MRSPSELTEAFRAQGLKITPQRQLIFRVLHDNPSHPSADSVYATAAADMPSISLRTVYQTLNDLADMGELQVLDVGTGAARFDPRVSDHQHLVCDVCGLVRDIECDVVDISPPRQVDGFAVERVEVVLRGVCPSCRLEAVEAPSPTSSRTTLHPHLSNPSPEQPIS